MNVTADCDGGIDTLDVALLDEDLSSFGTEVADLLLGDGFALAELGDLFVEEAGHCGMCIDEEYYYNVFVCGI